MSHRDLKSVDRNVDLRPIGMGDVDRVGRFLHEELNRRLSPAKWSAVIQPPWRMAGPNHGFMLVSGERVLGVYLAFYSEREVDGEVEKFCNLAAWCVAEEYRSHGLRLLRAILAQDGYTFTDLSPSGNVVPLNARLKFQYLDTATALVPNLPWLSWGSGIRVSSDRELIRSTLEGRDLEIFLDHADAAAAYHVVVRRGDRYCYVMFRRDRRKRFPLLASILHVGDPELFRAAERHVYSHLLMRFGIVATLAEKRVVKHHPPMSIPLRSVRPKMFRSSRLRPAQVDYLYSELTCVPW
ncbi:MAG TPA: hypothetical protein VNS34_27895 [Rhizobiaceae bacterium]|nr:hypothetical protein [Rhizobiaceae bacterium]